MRTAADIVELSLKQVGTYSPYDSGADPAEFAVALEFLDMMLAQWVAVKKFWWFVPMNQTFLLEADKQDYDIAALINNPQLQLITNVYLIKAGTTKREQVTLIRKADWESRQDDTETGTPCEIYVERNDTPTAYFWPKPNAGDTIEIAGAGYSPDVMNDRGEVSHGYPKAWELALVLGLGSIIGSGPVITLPLNEQNTLATRAAGAIYELNNSNNQENVRKPRATRPRDF